MVHGSALVSADAPLRTRGPARVAAGGAQRSTPTPHFARAGSSNQYSNTNCIAAPACGTTTPYAWDPKGYTKSLTTGIFAVKVVAVAAASEDTTLLINTNLPGGFATGNTGYSMTLLSNGRVMVMGKCGSGQCGEWQAHRVPWRRHSATH